MDAARFDAVTRVLATGSRRGVLGVLLALPWLSGLLAVLLSAEDTVAKGRRKRRKKQHKHGKGNGRRKGKKQKCKAKSRAKVCANRCGIVKNKQTCKKKVNCGACACDPPCDVCLTCEEGPTTPGVCVLDPAQQGDACGAPGQVCLDDGTCACDANSCAQGQHCQGEVCVCDASSCSGCCAGDGSCQPGTANDACGTGGAECTACSGVNTCGGGGTPGECGCTSTTCLDQGKNCGAINDGCGATLECGNCAAPETCGGGDPGTEGVCGCTPSTCPAGANCDTVPNICGGEVSCGGPCDNPEPICVENVCSTCSTEQPCLDGCCAGDGSCQPGTALDACGAVGETCQPCGSGQLCVNGECKVCLAGLCEPGSTSDCQYATLQEAIDDAGGPATLNLCARTYPGPITIARDLTLSGAGTKQTSLDGPTTDRVLGIAGGTTVTLQNLKVTGGAGGISSAGTLTLSGVAVTGNTASSGGGIYNDGGTLTLDGSRVSGNTATDNGGGIFNLNSTVEVEVGAFVCNNTPASGQCYFDPAFPDGYIGACPSPGASCSA